MTVCIQCTLLNVLVSVNQIPNTAHALTACAVVKPGWESLGTSFLGLEGLTGKSIPSTELGLGLIIL